MIQCSIFWKTSLGLSAVVTLLFVTLNACGIESIPARRTVTLRGTISDESSRPVSGITIVEESTGLETMSASDGTFQLRTMSTATEPLLHLSFGSYETRILVPQRLAAGTIEFSIASDRTLSNVMVTVTSVIDDTTPLPTDTPSTDPAPTPPPLAGTPLPGGTPTPSSPFDQNGTTTQFGIPTGLTGSTREGRQELTARCSDCHGELGRGWNFPRLKRRIAEAPMFLTIPDRALADITAYLNRGS